ncbi:MAG: hypothetical protein ACR2H2_02640 [Solirubrobacteraceae bacterium]
MTRFDPIAPQQVGALLFFDQFRDDLPWNRCKLQIVKLQIVKATIRDGLLH